MSSPHVQLNFLIPREAFSLQNFERVDDPFIFLQEASQPKLSQMAYVTAGTYYEDEILQMELTILNVGHILPLWFLPIFLKESISYFF